MKIIHCSVCGLEEVKSDTTYRRLSALPAWVCSGCVREAEILYQEWVDRARENGITIYIPEELRDE
jgi:hypothetical protein